MGMTSEGLTAPLYPKGHAGRLLVVLAAIDLLDRPTAASVAKVTGLSKGNIDQYAAKLTELGVTIVKTGPVYQVEDWGQIVQPSGIRALFRPEAIGR